MAFDLASRSLHHFWQCRLFKTEDVTNEVVVVSTKTLERSKKDDLRFEIELTIFPSIYSERGFLTGVGNASLWAAANQPSELCVVDFYFDPQGIGEICENLFENPPDDSIRSLACTSKSFMLPST